MAKKRGVKSEYDAWVNMKHRCNSPVNKQYKDYGGRGITVCLEWQNSFSSFLRDMGKKPPNPTGTRKDEWSLDRIDNDGNYEATNCRWAQRSTQQLNSRLCERGVLITIATTSLTVKQWSKAIGISPGSIRARYYAGKTGLDLIKPVLKRTISGKYKRKITPYKEELLSK